MSLRRPAVIFPIAFNAASVVLKCRSAFLAVCNGYRNLGSFALQKKTIQ